MSIQTIYSKSKQRFADCKQKCRIEKVTEMAYIVKSQSTPLKRYVVSNVIGDWTCECTDHVEDEKVNITIEEGQLKPI